MRNSWIQRILVIAMLAISTQHMQAAWYSSWGDFQNSVSTQWNSFTDWVTSWWKKTPAEVKVGVYTAYKERKLTPTEQQQQNELNTAITTFLNRLKSFAYDLEQASMGKKDWSALVSPNQIIINDLDSIDANGIPKTILSAAMPLNDPAILTDLKSSFQFLRPQLRWSDLSNVEKLETLKVPVETFKTLAVYIKNNAKYSEYRKWLEMQFNRMSRGQSPAPEQLVPLERTDWRTYLTVLRHYKIDNVYNKLKANASDFANNINQIYTKLQVNAPAVSWLNDVFK